MKLRSDIQEHLAKELEGGLFTEISMCSIFGNKFVFVKDWYTVLNGIVYSVGNGKKHKTNDDLINVKSSCKRVGKYCKGKVYTVTTKSFQYSELKKLIKL